MRFWIIILTFSFTFPCKILAQGCSDAGVCTAGAMGTGSRQSEELKGHFGFDYILGMGEHFEFGEQKTFYNSFQLKINIKIFNKTHINAKAPYTFISGDLANTKGFGDFSLNLNRKITSFKGGIITGQIGLKIPSNNANKQQNNKPLPMAFQTSLGTYDFMANVIYQKDLWKFALGYQHPFNRNKNEFLHSEWSGNENASDYFESRHLKRGADLAGRIERRLPMNNFDLFLSLVPIYRLQKSKILKGERSQVIDLTNRPTLNINVAFQYPVTSKIKLKASYGSPVIWRRVRPDGLTRIFVLTTSLKYELH